jgi:hypothetical protein
MYRALADAHGILIRRLEGNGPLARQEVSIEMNVKEMGLEVMYWIQLSQVKVQ